MIARLAGAALDARLAVHGTGALHDRANASRWIAANTLAAADVRVSVDGRPPLRARALALHAPCLVGLLAALAAFPALIDLRTLPRGWRIALRALGVPGLHEPIAAALAQDVAVLEHGRRGEGVSVEVALQGYRVHIARPDRLIA